MSTDLERRFGFHPATPKTGPLHREVRGVCLITATELVRLTPPGREQSLALTALQEAMMWANAAIACDPDNIAEHEANDATIHYIDRAGRATTMDPPEPPLPDPTKVLSEPVPDLMSNLRKSLETRVPTDGLSRVVALDDFRDQRAYA